MSTGPHRPGRGRGEQARPAVLLPARYAHCRRPYDDPDPPTGRRSEATQDIATEELDDMQTLAHFADGGPGPWILLFPLIWALVIGGGITLLRRTVWRGRRGPWRPPAVEDDSPIAVLGHRFASGEIDEDEYWRRLSVLDEQFGRTGKRGAA